MCRLNWNVRPQLFHAIGIIHKHEFGFKGCYLFFRDLGKRRDDDKVTDRRCFCASEWESS